MSFARVSPVMTCLVVQTEASVYHRQSTATSCAQHAAGIQQITTRETFFSLLYNNFPIYSFSNLILMAIVVIQL